MQIKAVLTPALRFTLISLSDTLKVPDVEPTNAFRDASLDEMCGESVEEVGAALRPRVVDSCRPLTTTVIALGDLLREVVLILLQAIVRERAASSVL